VGALVDGLAARGRLDDTLLVVTADHGEEFSDHGGFEHGHTLYDELLHVPLLIRMPGGAAEPRRFPGVVRLMDLAPTILEEVGVEVPAEFDGQTLSPQLDGGPGTPRPVVSTGNMWGPAGRSLRASGLKLIEQPDAEGRRLFDVVADPREMRDLADERPDRVAELQQRLDELDGAASRAPRPELSDAEREQLRALGYGQ
jgi:arylsulfatase A-like enzyme